MLGGLGLLQFPKVPWALSFNSCEIEHGGLIHDQFPTEAIVPFESTGLAIVADSSLLLLQELSPHSDRQSVPPAVRRRKTSFGAGLSVG